MNARLLRATVVVALAAASLGGAAWLTRRWAAEPAALAEARAALDRRDFIGAGARLDAHLAAHPDDLTARFLAAQAARRRGDFAQAGRDLQLFADGGGPADRVRRETRLLAVHRGTLDDSDSLLDAADAEADPGDRQLILEAVIEGNLHSLAPTFAPHPVTPPTAEPPAALRRARRAVDRYREGATTPPDRAQGLVWRARCRELGGDHPGAVADLRDALALTPDHVEAAFLLALFLSNEAPRETRALLESLAARFPDDARFLFPLASCLRRLGELEAAGGVVDRLLAAAPAEPQFLLERGQLLLDLRKPAEAEPVLRRAADADPADREAAVALARCLRLLGRRDEAVQYLDRVAEPRPPTKP